MLEVAKPSLAVLCRFVLYDRSGVNLLRLHHILLSVGDRYSSTAVILHSGPWLAWDNVE